MEGLADLVARSLVRHGCAPAFDHSRLQWSKWFPCQDSFSLVLAPSKPGIFALGEKVTAPAELALGEGKRRLALFQISEGESSINRPRLGHHRPFPASKHPGPILE